MCGTQGKAAILRVAGKVGAVQVACRVPVPEDEYVGRLKFGLAEVVYEWARGMVPQDRGARGAHS